jgi:molybdopterin-containing oxidoreductase family iron-sulfur binding subunit
VDAIDAADTGAAVVHPATRDASADARTHFWRTLEEMEGRSDDATGQTSVAPPLSRRTFLGLMGASLALAGGGCSRPPLEKIVPYRDGPAEATYGQPVYYATAIECAGDAIGVLVECNMGRPTKIEGNPDHPASLGATDAITQAAILELWDPDRSQQVRRGGRPATWGEAVSALRAQLQPREGAVPGAGLAVLTETVTSPSLLAALDATRAALPGATWHCWQPLHRDNVLAGAYAEQTAGQVPVYHFDRARTILALDADFLGDMPGHVRNARDFAATRHAGVPAAARSRLYALEAAMSLTGSAADHRLPLRGSDTVDAVRAIARALGVSAPPPVRDVVPAAWLASVTADLRSSGNAAAVVAGDRQPPEVHALAYAMNQRLGAVGTTVVLVAAPAGVPADHAASLRDLAQRMSSGAVRALVILGANPLYTAPADIEFAAALQRVPFSLHHGLYVDETAARCGWHVPAAHPLESWGDVRTADGTVTLQQPCIAPLYDGRTEQQVLAALRGDATASARDLAHAHWRERVGSAFDTALDDALRKGILPQSIVVAAPALTTATTRPTRTPPPRSTPSAAPLPTTQPAASATEAELRRQPVDGADASAGAGHAVELEFVPDPRLRDGRYANNPWLQELPKPLSQLTWDNAAEMSPALAARIGVTNEDRVEIEANGRRLVAPVWIAPGVADGTIVLALGHGRTHAGTVGNGRGFDAYVLRTAATQWHVPQARARKVPGRYALASAQTHGRMEGRDIVRSHTAAEAAACTASACETPAFRDARTLYASPPRGPYAWAMSIDLAACIGCGTCTVACQAENNIPTVGKDEVRNGREMHWIRVDRYYAGPSAAPRVVHQPVPCMQCEHAPCEVVCPVEASVHDAQGINVQVYNRCVGTRFCSNNCPYKVRRFNFFQYSDDVPQHNAQRNPQVTVRSRGVMEKCNYCLQRITTARITADREGRSLRDGEVVTACQAACPTQAIVFGDLNDPNSEVVRRKRSPLDYALLAELNTRPRTTYLAHVSNPAPALGDTPAASNTPGPGGRR